MTILELSPGAVAAAAEVLSNEGVALWGPGTVYAYMNDATSAKACDRVYALKGRPATNPLMIIVSGLQMARDHVVLADDARTVAEAFWPGPLTVAVPARRGSGLAPHCSNAEGYVAVCHHAAEEENKILDTLGRPVASSSANVSGRVSPTAIDMIDEGILNAADIVVDCGPMRIGIETTLVSFQFGRPVLVRPGPISVDRIYEETGIAVAYPRDEPAALRALDAGTFKTQESFKHYDSGMTLRLNAEKAEASEVLLAFGPGYETPHNLSENADPVEAGRNLYRALHDLREQGAKRVAVTPIPDVGIGIALNQRLRESAKSTR